MMDYSGLIRKLSNRGLTRTDLVSRLGISSRTVAKIGRGEKIANHVLVRIASFLDCPPEDLCKAVSGNALLQALRDEKSICMSGGIYHELQVRMTYNSNHIEGSRLSEDQTRQIFETNTVDAGEGIPVDDIIETVNHFRAIDYVIDAAEEPLTEAVICELHRILKQSTKDAALAWFAVGGYKTRPNVIGGRETTKPKDVPARMKSLLREYAAIDTITINDIIRFHYEFEKIHPFQDGNGRVGRLIALKECLRHSIVPFLIEDAKKLYYYRGLAEWEHEPGLLTEICLDGQDTFLALMNLFDIDGTIQRGEEVGIHSYDRGDRNMENGNMLTAFESFLPEETALLIIDMEKAFVEPEAALCIHGAKATVPACEEAVEHARRLGIRIIWVKRVYREDGSDMEIPRRKTLEKRGIKGVLAPGSTGVNSVEEPEGLMRLPEETVIIKPRWSAFFRTGLDRILKESGITTVLLAGTTTPNCIRATCYDAIAYDYRTVVLSRCTSSETEEIQRTNLEDMLRAGAEII